MISLSGMAVGFIDAKVKVRLIVDDRLPVEIGPVIGPDCPGTVTEGGKGKLADDTVAVGAGVLIVEDSCRT